MPGGRPALYPVLVEDKLDIIMGWAKGGLTQQQIASNLGINEKTLIKWKHQYKELDDALKVGKDEADIQVVNAMHRAATGYWIEEQVVTVKGDVVTTKKWIAPNPTMAIFWSKNRMPSEWRDKREVVQDVGQNLAKLIEESMSRSSLPASQVIDVTPEAEWDEGDD